MNKSNDPFALVIFGITGDLSQKKILPAIFHLYSKSLISSDFTLIGNSRQELSKDGFVDFVYQSLSKHGEGFDKNLWQKFKINLNHLAGDSTNPQFYNQLSKRFKALESQGKKCANKMFHISTLPSLYPKIIENLGQSELIKKSEGWLRILIEKPFGTDLENAKELNKTILKNFSEDQIFRVDHFLGKDTIQNIIAFRFANTFFEDLWDRNHIDHIQITFAENIGIEKRGTFYDATGAISDVVQNHLLQLLAITTMDRPKSLAAEDIRNARASLLGHIRIYEESEVGKNVVVGQYDKGTFNGKEAVGYLQEEKVDPKSKTETFAALKLYIDKTNWQDVPIYIRTGKRIEQTVNDVVVVFKQPEKNIFEDQISPNLLIIRIQPSEGIFLTLDAKKPGDKLDLDPVTMSFCYHQFFEDHIEAYEQVIRQAYLGNTAWFARSDGSEASWEIINPIHSYLNKNQITPFKYKAGSWGPKEAFNLIEKDGRSWVKPIPHVCPI